MKIWDWCAAEDVLSFHTDVILDFLGWKSNYQKCDATSSLQSPEAQQVQLHKWPFSRSQEMLSLFPARPERVQLLESADCLIQKKSMLWPELLLPVALKRSIRRRIQTLDLRKTAYLMGDDSTIRSLAITAVSMGFSQICLVSEEDSFLQEQKSFLQKRLMGISFDTVMARDLTLQPQNSGFLLNALNLNEKKDTLQDIAYFNFMTSNGIFVDLVEGPAHKILQEEAARANLKCILPVEVEWAWWAEVGSRLEKPLIIPPEKEKEFLSKLDLPK